MAKYKLGVIHPRLEFVGVEMLTSFCFLWHNVDSRYARKPIMYQMSRILNISKPLIIDFLRN